MFLLKKKPVKKRRCKLLDKQGKSQLGLQVFQYTDDREPYPSVS
jgi:hypothetical protein